MTRLEFSLAQKISIVVLLLIILFAGSVYLYRLTSSRIVVEPSATENNLQKGASICVYVCGEVIKPGLYNLPYGSRVEEALKCAGTMETSDLTGVNLALILYDEDMVYVPKKGEKRAKTYKAKSGNVRYRIDKSHEKNKEDLKKIEKIDNATENEPQELLEKEGLIEIKKR